jgi:hypothetical protein
VSPSSGRLTYSFAAHLLGSDAPIGPAAKCVAIFLCRWSKGISEKSG